MVIKIHLIQPHFSGDSQFSLPEIPSMAFIEVIIFLTDQMQFSAWETCNKWISLPLPNVSSLPFSHPLWEISCFFCPSPPIEPFCVPVVLVPSPLGAVVRTEAYSRIPQFYGFWTPVHLLGFLHPPKIKHAGTGQVISELLPKHTITLNPALRVNISQSTVILRNIQTEAVEHIFPWCWSYSSVQLWKSWNPLSPTLKGNK